MDFPKIGTGNGFFADLGAVTNNRLELMVEQIEKLIVAIAQLEHTIVVLDEKNGKLQNKIFWLTIIGVVLATLQIIQAIDIIRGWLFTDV